MSWVNLLAVGRSLVGLKDGGTRYRVSERARLPKFPAASNPFRGTTLPSGALREAAREPETVQTPNADEVAAACCSSVSCSGRQLPQATGETPGKLKRLAARVWAAARPGSMSPFRARVPVKSAVQTELALERVKVVRNDLSDADVEVVPVRAASEPAASVPGAEDTAQPKSVPQPAQGDNQVQQAGAEVPAGKP